MLEVLKWSSRDACAYAWEHLYAFPFKYDLEPLV